MAGFYYYDDSGHCIRFDTVQVSRQQCTIKLPLTGTVNGFTSKQFTEQINTDFTAFNSSNPQLLIAFGSAVAVSALYSFFRK